MTLIWLICYIIKEYPLLISNGETTAWLITLIICIIIDTINNN